VDIIQTIKTFAERECRKPESRYGAEPFEFHFVPVAAYAAKLAEEIGGDREIILLAAWLHDIGSIRHGRIDHELTGAQIAEEKLTEIHYPLEKIKAVKQCILNHRSSQAKNRVSLEEKILADADALAAFDNIGGIFKAALVYENKNQGEAQISVRQKLEKKWAGLHFAQSKQLIKPKYAAAMLLLK
jgi:uncharacterized protein